MRVSESAGTSGTAAAFVLLSETVASWYLAENEK